MTKKDLIAKYKPYPTYTQIATEAFDAGFKQGLKENQTVKFIQTEAELKKLKAELKSLWKTLEDPEACGKLLAGM